MNIKQFILGATGAGILTGTIYFTQGQEYKHEGVKILVSNTGTRTQETISPFQDPQMHGMPTKLNTISTNADMQDFLDKNPILKMRIQNMSWYRDFLTSRISREIFEEYLSSALNIEEILVKNPGILEKIQYEIWWQRYLRGDTNPVDMFAGNMTSLLRLEELRKKDPEFYTNLQKSPNWSQGIQHGSDYIVYGQEDFAISASLRIQQINSETGLREELARFGFSEKDIFSDDWSTGQGFYGAIDVIRRIRATDTERLEWFYSTELGRQYRDGKITDWIQLEQFLES